MDTTNVKKDILRVILSFFSNILDKTPTTGGKWAVRNTLVTPSGTAVVGNTETPTFTSYAAGTTIAAGAKSVTIATDAAYAGNILGVAGAASTTYTFTASQGNTLAAIAITRTAGNFTVIVIS